jgi:hypothetical protein
VQTMVEFGEIASTRFVGKAGGNWESRAGV